MREAGQNGARYAKTYITAYRIPVAMLCWFGLVLQYGLVMTGSTGPGPLARTVNFFSFFTIECNLLTALAMTLPWLAPTTAAARFFLRTSTRTVIAACMIVVGAVYVLVLRHLWQPQGLDFVADATVHYAMPVLYFIDWLIVPRARPNFSEMFRWLIFPLAYAVWSLVHGAATGFYPYGFINADKLGYAGVLVNMAALTAVFVVLGLGLSGLKTVVGSRR